MLTEHNPSYYLIPIGLTFLTTLALILLTPQCRPVYDRTSKILKQGFSLLIWTPLIAFVRLFIGIPLLGFSWLTWIPLLGFSWLTWILGSLSCAYSRFAWYAPVTMAMFISNLIHIQKGIGGDIITVIEKVHGIEIPTFTSHATFFGPNGGEIRPTPVLEVEDKGLTLNKTFLCEHVDYVDSQCPNVSYNNVSVPKNEVLALILEVRAFIKMFNPSHKILEYIAVLGLVQEVYTLSLIGTMHLHHWFLTYPSYQAASLLARLSTYIPIAAIKIHTPETIQKYLYLRNPRLFLLRFNGILDEANWLSIGFSLPPSKPLISILRTLS